MSNARKRLSRVALIALALMTWAALDDITTGNELGFLAEWSVVAVSSLLLAGWLAATIRKRLCGH